MDFIKELLTSDDIISSINSNLDELFTLIPEFKYMVGFEHNNPNHHLDVWEHTLYALSLSENNFEVRLTLLLHDIGKPFSYQDREVRHFKNHPQKSFLMANEILNRLGFDEELIDKICYLVLKHDDPIQYEDILKNEELELIRFEVQRCDSLAHHPDYLEKRMNYLDEVKAMLKLKRSSR